MPNDPIKITPQELERIKQLPSKKFRLGGTVQQGFFDEENETLYYLDSEGNWMVKRARIKKVEDEKPEEPADTSDDNTESENDDDEDDGEDRLAALKESLSKPISEKIPLTRMKLLIIIGGLIGLCIIGSIFSHALFGPSSNQPSEEPAVEEPVAEEPDPSLNTIQVIQVTKDLIPGDIISKDIIQSATISAETYNQITLGGTNIYQFDRAESLIGKYATAYIPAGQYLAYNNVASAYTPAKNPWVNEQQGKVYVTAPLDASTAKNGLLNFGAKVDMSIRKETVTETQAPDETPDIPGVEHKKTVYQSVSIDTYEMENVIVCDILNADKVSIYDKYTAFMEIPAGEQLNYIRMALLDDTELEEALTPAYIRIKISTEQAEAFGDLSDKSITISYKLHKDTDIDATTDSKREYAAEARALADTIKEAIDLNAKAAETGEGQ